MAKPDTFDAKTAARDDRYDQAQRRGRPGRLSPQNSARITHRITAVSVGVGLILALGKAWLFSQTGSIGILSSLVHSALDILGAVGSFFAVRYAALKPNETYRYGRGKAEGFAAIFQVCLIILAAGHLLEEVFQRASHDHAVTQPGLAIFGLIGLMVVTLWLIIAQSWAIRATGSIAVRGDRAHYTADLLANLFVAIGLGAAMLTDQHWIDPLVGGLMAVWLLFTAFQIARLAWAQLMDKELNPDERRMITRLAMSDASVRAVHDLRTRASGPILHIQMRLDLDDHHSLSTAHEIVIAAEGRIKAAFPAADIIIHPHPVGCTDMTGHKRFS